MDSRHLRVFLRIAELRSISRAAVSLGLSQPSLSQLLLRLEDEVGVELFNRTARGVTLTEGGRIFQEHARQILRNIEQALEDVRVLDIAASGQAVLAVPPSVAQLIGIPLVEALDEQVSHVTVRLVEAFGGTIRGWIEAGKIDLGIMYDLGPLRHLSARPLVSEELYLAGPPGAFADGDDDMPDVALKRLCNYPLIAPGPQHGLRQLVENEASKLGCSLEVVQEIDALGQLVTLVERGHGHAILPLAALVHARQSQLVSVARIGGGALRRSLCLVRNPAQLVTHASLRVEDQTVRVIAELIECGVWQAQLETGIQ